VIEALGLIIHLDNIQFSRKSIFMEAKKFKAYFDGSKQCIGVSVIVKNTLPNGEVIFRLLCNKSKICSESINTAPRSELTAALVSTQVYTLVKEELSEF
jgi:hypothetical protein